MNYTLLDCGGEIVGNGECQDCDVQYLAVPAGGQVLLNQTPPDDFFRLWHWDGKTFVDSGPRFPTTYVTQRLSSYPPATEQLDMLWHAMADGSTPAIEPWFSVIKAIKDAHPKP